MYIYQGVEATIYSQEIIKINHKEEKR